MLHCSTASALSVNSYAVGPPTPSQIYFRVWPTNVPKKPRWTLFHPPFFFFTCVSFGDDPWRAVHFQTYGTCQHVRMRISATWNYKASRLRLLPRRRINDTWNRVVRRWGADPRLVMVVLQYPRMVTNTLHRRLIIYSEKWSIQTHCQCADHKFYMLCLGDRTQNLGVKIRINLKRNLLYIRNRFVPRSKHFPPRLQRPIS